MYPFVRSLDGAHPRSIESIRSCVLEVLQEEVLCSRPLVQFLQNYLD